MTKLHFTSSVFSHSPLPVVCTVRTASSASRPALRSLAGGWRSSHCAAPSESGCHLVSPGNERSPPSFSPPPGGFVARLPPAGGKKLKKKKKKNEAELRTMKDIQLCSVICIPRTMENSLCSAPTPASHHLGV